MSGVRRVRSQISWLWKSAMISQFPSGYLVFYSMPEHAGAFCFTLLTSSDCQCQFRSLVMWLLRKFLCPGCLEAHTSPCLQTSLDSFDDFQTVLDTAKIRTDTRQMIPHTKLCRILMRLRCQCSEREASPYIRSSLAGSGELSRYSLLQAVKRLRLFRCTRVVFLNLGVTPDHVPVLFYIQISFGIEMYFTYK